MSSFAATPSTLFLESFLHRDIPARPAAAQAPASQSQMIVAPPPETERAMYQRMYDEQQRALHVRQREQFEAEDVALELELQLPRYDEQGNVIPKPLDARIRDAKHRTRGCILEMKAQNRPPPNPNAAPTVYRTPELLDFEADYDEMSRQIEYVSAEFSQGRDGGENALVSNPTQKKELTEFELGDDWDNQRPVQECDGVPLTIQERDTMRNMVLDLMWSRVGKGMTPELTNAEYPRVLQTLLKGTPNSDIQKAMEAAGFPAPKTSKALLIDNMAKLCQRSNKDFVFSMLKGVFHTLTRGLVLRRATPLSIMVLLYSASVATAQTIVPGSHSHDEPQEEVRQHSFERIASSDAFIRHLASGVDQVCYNANEVFQETRLRINSTIPIESYVRAVAERENLQTELTIVAFLIALFFAFKAMRALRRYYVVHKKIQFKNEVDGDIPTECTFDQIVYHAKDARGKKYVIRASIPAAVKTDALSILPNSTAEGEQQVIRECSIQGSPLIATEMPTYLFYIWVALDGVDGMSTFIGSGFRYTDMLLTCGHNCNFKVGQKVTIQSAKGQVSYIHDASMAEDYEKSQMRKRITGCIVLTAIPDFVYLGINASDMGRLNLTTVKRDKAQLPADCSQQVFTIGSNSKIAPKTLKASGPGSRDHLNRAFFNYQSSTDAGFSGAPVCADGVDKASPIVVAMHLQSNRSRPGKVVNEGLMFGPIASYIEWQNKNAPTTRAQESSWEYFIKTLRKHQAEIEDTRSRDVRFDREVGRMFLNTGNKVIAFSPAEWVIINAKNKDGSYDFERNLENLENRLAQNEQYELDNYTQYDRGQEREREEFYQFEYDAYEKVERDWDQERRDADEEEKEYLQGNDSMYNDGMIERQSALKKAREQTDAAAAKILAIQKESGEPSKAHAELLKKIEELKQFRAKYDEKYEAAKSEAAKRAVRLTAEQALIDERAKVLRAEENERAQAAKAEQARLSQIQEINERVAKAKNALAARELEIEAKAKADAEAKIARMKADEAKQATDAAAKIAKLQAQLDETAAKAAARLEELKKKQDEDEMKRKAARAAEIQNKMHDDAIAAQAALQKKIEQNLKAVADAEAKIKLLEEAESVSSPSESEKLRDEHAQQERDTLERREKARREKADLMSEAKEPHVDEKTAQAQKLRDDLVAEEKRLLKCIADLENAAKPADSANIQKESAANPKKAKSDKKGEKQERKRSEEQCACGKMKFSDCNKTHPYRKTEQCKFSPCRDSCCERQHGLKKIIEASGKTTLVEVQPATDPEYSRVLKGDPDEQAKQRAVNAAMERAKNVGKKQLDDKMREKLAAETLRQSATLTEAAVCEITLSPQQQKEVDAAILDYQKQLEEKARAANVTRESATESDFRSAQKSATVAEKKSL